MDVKKQRAVVGSPVRTHSTHWKYQLLINSCMGDVQQQVDRTILWAIYRQGGPV